MKADNDTKTEYTYRLLAKIVIEASSPLAVGKGEKNIITDAPVATDVNGLPYIPGTALAGVIRHELKKTPGELDSLFGYQKEGNGKGSEIIFTDAKILDSNSRVIDGPQRHDIIKEDPLLRYYYALPIRQHVKINSRGVPDNTGKFDGEVVYAGSRFCFEIEIVSKDDNMSNLQNAINCLYNKSFRLGSGTRCGYGEIKVVSVSTRAINLENAEDCHLYLDKSSSLNSDWSGWTNYTAEENENDEWTTFCITLTPRDLFTFSSGLGDDEVDNTPMKEQIVEWEGKSGKMSERKILIPATSVKGAIAHRVKFYYNQLSKNFIDKPNNSVNANFATEQLFGSNSNGKTRGNVIFTDVFAAEQGDKPLTHVSIDRFTGGQRHGALYNEKASIGNKMQIKLNISVLNTVLRDDNVKKALIATLKDICTGQLALGGATNRGHGIFSGTYEPKI